MTQPNEQKWLKQHQMISEATAHLGEYELSQLNKNGKEVDEEAQAQNLISGSIVIGNLPLVKSLLGNRAVDVNRENPYFGRPLHIAAAWGHVAIVRYLLDHGADPNLFTGPQEENTDDWEHVHLGSRHRYQSPEGSALRAAALGGHEQIVNLLLEPKYGLSLSRAEYLRATLAGVRGGHVNVINILLQATGETVPGLGAFREEMLWEAVRHNQEAVVQMLLDLGADVSAPPYADGRDHGDALNIAASQGYDRLVHMLLDNGADLNYESPRSRTPIIAAARGGHEEVVQVLLEWGGTIGEAFISAADGGQVHLLRYLLQKGVDVHKKDNLGRTIGMEALERAIITKNPAVISILVDLGVPINHDSPTPHDHPMVIAKTFSAQWIVDFLLSLGAEDREVDPDETPDTFLEDCYSLQMSRGGIRLTKRTWEWVGKY
ncbi:hypothetical protein N8T08_002220 [Aspergillus melleus]|uniref:Uncharacterized protein n=1 Tax=Aspergillus melleus TaxID=138277 RepID=A0ACC3B8W7_9EURO|nr:hypothetical protein N8T08_002220 [Aspergillus melleus]